jgi:integrase
MALLGILTGMRVGEILGLRRKDVNFVSRQITIAAVTFTHAQLPLRPRVSLLVLNKRRRSHPNSQT